MYRFISRKNKLIDQQSSRNVERILEKYKKFKFFELGKFPPETF